MKLLKNMRDRLHFVM